ncbi:MAG: hypothetical protein J5525_04850 [Lachnospiraceae bacterium]|nr:hypothetical protein [Lachnospiraceae bacterium]
MSVIRSSKRITKKVLDNRVGKEYFSLNDISDNTKVVSFDIFDTLILRDVDKPSDVFKIIEKEYNIPGFYKKRIMAEQEARKKDPCNPEVKIEDIYNSYEGISQEEAAKYIDFELQTEMDLCHPNLDIVPFYEACKEKYKVIITSDMYISNDMMEKILISCGITGYIKLYVSCDVGRSKYNKGELFEHIASDLKIRTDEITHFGDDYKSDYMNAKSKGVHANKLRRLQRNKLISDYLVRNGKKKNSEQFGIIYNFIRNTTSKDFDFYYRFGYENVGVLLWSFCKWLIEKMSSENIEQVLFIARDGYMIKEVYDALGYSKVIPSYYFEMSRRSAMIPASFSKGLSYDEMLEIIRLPACIKAGQLLEAWGLEETDYKDVLIELEIDDNTEYRRSGLKEEIRIRNLYDRVKEDIKANAAKEYELFLKYLEKYHLEKKTALVDIGWSATIQKELIKTRKNEGLDVDVRGFYLALDRTSSVNSEDLNAEGFLWDHYNVYSDEPEEGAYVGMIETLFHEQLGSVKKYSSDGDDVLAKRYPYEYEMPGGILDEISVLNRIQQGTTDFTKAISDRSHSEVISLNGKEAFGLLKNCIMEPSMEMIKNFGSIRYFDIGDFTYLAKPKMSLGRYILNPKRFTRDFYEAEWPIGFLKAVLRINISYEGLWNTLWYIKHANK